MFMVRQAHHERGEARGAKGETRAPSFVLVVANRSFARGANSERYLARFALGVGDDLASLGATGKRGRVRAYTSLHWKFLLVR